MSVGHSRVDESGEYIMELREQCQTSSRRTMTVQRRSILADVLRPLTPLAVVFLVCLLTVRLAGCSICSIMLEDHIAQLIQNRSLARRHMINVKCLS